MDDLGLEPLDPFVDDVFCGDGDHPAGLWHPGLMPAPYTPAVHEAEPTFPDATGRSSNSNSCSEGFGLSHEDMLPAEEFMPGQLPGMHCWEQRQHNSPTHSQQLQPEQKLQLQQAAGCCTPDASIHTAFNAAGSVQQVPNTGSSQQATAAESDAEPSMDSNSNVSGGRATTGSESSSWHRTAGLKVCEPPAAITAAEPEFLTANALIDAEAAPAPTAASPSMVAKVGSADSAPLGSGADGSDGSVPDIDDVSEEQQEAMGAAAAVAGTQQQQQHTSLHQLAVQQDLQQQGPAQVAAAGLDPPLHAVQQHQQQQELYDDAAAVDMALEGMLQELMPAEEEAAAAAAAEAADTPVPQPRPSQPAPAAAAAAAQAAWQLEAAGGEDMQPTAMSSSSSQAAPAPVQAATVATKDADKVHESAAAAAAAAANTTFSEHAKPAAAAAAAEDDAEGFASPNTSWHSCMTSASHASASAHSVLSAASFATARGMSVLTTLLPSQQQQQHSSSSSGAGSSSSTGEGIAAPADEVSAQPVAVEDARDAADHIHIQLAEPPAAAEAIAAAAAVAVAEGPAGSGADDPLGASVMGQCCQQQQQQQQQVPAGLSGGLRDDELWQDVGPPSLVGSSPPSPAGYATIHHHHALQQQSPPPPAVAEGMAAGPAAEEVAVFDDDCDGHGHYYAAAQQHIPAAAAGYGSAAGSMYQYHQNQQQQQQQQHVLGYPAAYQHAYPGLYSHGQQPHAAVAASSHMLRQSELVDLSLSTSMHPGQQQQQQHRPPGWLTAHQQLPPAAAQAVERAVTALNDSYFYHGRSGVSSPQQQQQQQQMMMGPSVMAATASGAGLGASGMAIRRTVGQQWSHTLTQPQQDQRARHRLLRSQGQQHAGGNGPFGWPGPALIGQWFSSTVQQPLAAAAGRAAAGVGQRLTAAGGSVGRSGNQGAAVVAAVTAAGHAGRSSTSGSGLAATGIDTAAAAAAGWGADGFDDAVIVERTPDLPQSLQEQEDEAFRGLLFMGGRDSHGRPVVIINTDAIPAGHNPAPRDAALAYLLKKLTPVVTRGPYVLVMVAFHNGPQFRLLPGVWCVRAYQSLPRAFHKNVKHVILLQPSLMVRAALALLYPFVSSKAHAKIKQVPRLLDIESATAGEVQVPHLGEAFLTTVQYITRKPQGGQSGPVAAAGTAGRTVPVPGTMHR